MPSFFFFFSPAIFGMDVSWLVELREFLEHLGITTGI
jgi:hypothetical protein